MKYDGVPYRETPLFRFISTTTSISVSLGSNQGLLSESSVGPSDLKSPGKNYFSVAFGYSPEMVEGFVDASDETLSRADPELRRKSYQNLTPLRKQFAKHNDNFFC